MTRIVIASLLAGFLAATLVPATAADRHESVRTIEPRLPAGGIVVENLLGSITVRGSAGRGTIKVSARTVAEADGADAARELAESVELSVVPGDVLTVHVALPVDRYPALRLPRSERDGLMAKWIAPFVRRKTTSVSWQDRTVEVGNVRGAPGLAVHVEVELPLETRATLRQVLGTVHAIGIRGDVTLDVVDGLALAEQAYGKLNVRAGSAPVEIRKFGGDVLDVTTGSGDVNALEVHTGTCRLATTAGTITATGVVAESFEVSSETGDVHLVDLDPRAADLRVTSGEVQADVVLTRTRSLSATTDDGDVTLRLHRRTPFDLAVQVETGSVAFRDVDAEVLEEGDKTLRLKRGSGSGATIRVASRAGEVRILPH